ncbi:EAL domain-containing protein [Blastococcus sp. CT_GayMR20]|nr:EAL domain-containing protein [Blastococcus sp. CT_GayMR20]
MLPAQQRLQPLDPLAVQGVLRLVVEEQLLGALQGTAQVAEDRDPGRRRDVLGGLEDDRAGLHLLGHVHRDVGVAQQFLGDLRRALEGTEELFLNYQPKYTLDGERIEGLEALLRWQHPTEGLIPPGEFIPVAEGTGIILRLTERVLDLALAQMRCWLDAGHAVPVAVNLSTRCLLDAGLPDLVQRLLAEHGVPAALLRLEVTESAVMGDAARCMEVLQRLHDLGVKLSIDDFGTGYSSMAYLRRLPVDELKIDRSFVLGMTTTAADAVLVRTAIDLGHNLGLTVVAEGVEGAEHVTALRALGCDIAQGFHYARPMAAERMSELLDRVGTIHDAAGQVRSGS